MPQKNLWADTLDDSDGDSSTGSGTGTGTASGSGTGSAPVRRIRPAQATGSIGSPGFPMCGCRREGNEIRSCKWFHTARGCRYGDSCSYCHDCAQHNLHQREREAQNRKAANELIQGKTAMIAKLPGADLRNVLNEADWSCLAWAKSISVSVGNSVLYAKELSVDSTEPDSLFQRALNQCAEKVDRELTEKLSEHLRSFSVIRSSADFSTKWNRLLEAAEFASRHPCHKFVESEFWASCALLAEQVRNDPTQVAAREFTKLVGHDLNNYIAVMYRKAADAVVEYHSLRDHYRRQVSEPLQGLE